jgi:hypothetical protein
MVVNFVVSVYTEKYVFNQGRIIPIFHGKGILSMEYLLCEAVIEDP